MFDIYKSQRGMGHFMLLLLALQQFCIQTHTSYLPGHREISIWWHTNSILFVMRQRYEKSMLLRRYVDQCDIIINIYQSIA